MKLHPAVLPFAVIFAAVALAVFFTQHHWDNAVIDAQAAAEAGNASAQYELGMSYLERRGLPRDPVEAAKWLQRSANQSYGYAQYQLGRMYEEGLGVPQDYAAAHMWMTMSGENGFSGGRGGGWQSSGVGGEVGMLERRMTPAQIDEAKKRARDWRESHPHK